MADPPPEKNLAPMYGPNSTTLSKLTMEKQTSIKHDSGQTPYKIRKKLEPFLRN
jgi:hypothetical protein